MSMTTASLKAVAKRQPVDLQAIVRRFGPALDRSRRLHATQRKALWSIAHCRTPAMGGHMERCKRCEFVRYQYHSCRNRHCPQCQSRNSALWREARMCELLPVPYFHHVFTLPHKLNEWVLRSKRNYRALINLLFQAASETLLQFGSEQLGGRLGITMVLHTWDQRLRPHFHVHALVAAGALCDGGTRWAAGGRKFLFHVKALSIVFRAKYLDGLKELIVNDDLDIPKSLASMTATLRSGNTRRLMKHLKPPWVVYSKPPFAGPKKLIDYLSRYVHRTAISNDRILGIEGDDVRFSYRDRADGDRRKIEKLPGTEFLSRFSLHVLPKGLTRIRHYGFLANCIKAKSLAQCRRLLGTTTPRSEPTQSIAQWFLELTGIDLTACPQCGGELDVTELHPVRSGTPALMPQPRREPKSIDSS